jgi:hypothetical protein
MQYTMDDASWNKQTAAMKSLLNYQYTNASKAILALTWMKPDSSINSGHDAAGDVRKIKYARSIGMKGFVFFEFSEKNSDGTWYSDAPLISALTVPSSTNNYDAPFAATAPSCLPH